ncbi:PqqD family protein [Demequina phytophila]|uniref:PqqD family protein n=1 Tax=Demequina phytophila TaxID=1638981 RepID=UPI000782F5C5|nr:PqqD family protein [Demequina phytophila]
MTGTLTRAPGIAEVVHDDYAVVLNLARIESQQVPHLFEGSSLEIWVRIDGMRDLEAIVVDVAEAYGVEADTIAADVEAFVAALVELWLVSAD